MKVGDSGLRMALDTRSNLGNSTAFTVRIKRPDDTTEDRTLDATAIIPAVPPATYPTKINYTVQSGDFTVPGIYSIEVINTSSGQSTSEAVELYVGEGL